MSNSQLEYLVGSTWTVEDNLIKFSLVDSLHFPLSLEAVVSNPINVREVVYERYQAVRLIDLNSNRVLFYGKLEAVIPSYTGYYGDSVKLIARDNLQELLKVSVNEDVTYGAINRSAVIEDIINGGTGTEFSRHAWPGNILTSDTAKFKPSGTQAGSGDANRNLASSNRNALGLIEDFAKIDLQDSPNHKLGGRDFFLDTNFNKVASDTSGVATPYFHYFSRGTIPTTPQTNGLTLEFKGIEADQVNSVLPDFTFPRNSSEIVTKVRIEWVDEERIHQELELILIHHDAPASGAFVAGTNITWGSGKSAKIEAVISDNRALLISSANSNDTWLDTISGQTISDGTRTAAVNATDAAIAGSIRETIGQDIELVMKSLELEKLDETKNVALQTLQQSDDEIVRGNLTCVKWPTHKITDAHTGGAHSTILTDSGASFLNNGIRVGDEVVNVTDSVTGLITALNATTITTSGTPDMSWENGNTYAIYVPNRAGYVVYTKGFGISDIGDQNALITRISYDEGPGVQTAKIEVVMHVNGHVGNGLPKGNLTRSTERDDEANFAATKKLGVREISSLKWEYSGSFTTPTANQVNWSGGILKLSDERTFDIAEGNTGTISASAPGNGKEFLYFNIDSPTIFTSTPTQGATVAINTIYIAQFSRPTSGTVPEFIAFGTMGTSMQVDGTAITHFNTSVEGWTQEVGFSSTNANTVSWAGGNLTSGNGTVYAIAAGSVAGISTRWYVYLDINVSLTVLQQSSTAGDAVGNGKILVATAKNATSQASFFVYSGDAATKISGPDIEAGSIVAGNIATNAITADAILANNITAGKLDSTLILTTAIVISAAEAASGGRWELTSAGIIGYNSSNASQVRLISANTASGGKIIMGADGSETVALDVDGIQLIGAGNTSIDFRSTLNGSILGSIGLNASSNIEIASLGADIKITTVSSGTLTLTGVAGMDLIASADINISPTGGGKVVVATPITLFDGTTSNLSIRRSSDATTGLYFYTSGLYKGLVCKGNGRDLWWAASDGTNDWVVIDSHIDMNNHTITDCYEVRAGDGSAGDPSHTFDDHLTSGMYYDAGVAISAGGSIKMKLTTTEVTVSDDLNPNSTGSYRNLGNNSLRWAKLWSGSASDTTSDAELKENLTPISNGLDFISRLSPITFNRINDSEVQFGFTAQAVKQAVLDSGYTENLGVYSEKTDEVTGDTHWGIAYSTLIAPLVAAIKELKERIEFLEGN